MAHPGFLLFESIIGMLFVCIVFLVAMTSFSRLVHSFELYSQKRKSLIFMHTCLCKALYRYKKNNNNNEETINFTNKNVAVEVRIIPDQVIKDYQHVYISCKDRDFLHRYYTGIIQ